MLIKREDIQEFTNNNPEYTKEEIIELLYSIYDIQNNSEKYVVNEIVNYTMEENLKKMEKYGKRKEQLKVLKKLELPEQRSKEWYEMRKEKLTASSLASALDKCHFTTRNELLLSKIEEKPYQSNEITEWGVKYEDIAIAFYEEMYKVKVLDFGLIPHPTFDAFGASPDGICDDTGNDEYVSRMVEIKCPPKRKFTKTVPPHYLMQVQGQLEVCDLDECDFLQVKLDEYDNFTDYKNDVLDLSKPLDYSYPNIANYDETINGKTSGNLPKGCTISYRKEGELPDKLSYIYPKLLLSDDEYLEWIDEHIKKGYNIVETKWWKITRYELSTVNRDKNWWNGIIEHVLKFYNDYIHYKDNPKELAKLKERNEKKPKYKYKKKEIDIVHDKPKPFMLCE